MRAICTEEKNLGFITGNGKLLLPPHTAFPGTGTPTSGLQLCFTECRCPAHQRGQIQGYKQRTGPSPQRWSRL